MRLIVKGAAGPIANDAGGGCRSRAPGYVASPNDSAVLVFDTATLERVATYLNGKSGDTVNATTYGACRYFTFTT